MATDISIATDATLAGHCVNVYNGILARYVRTDGGVKQLESDNKITSEGTGYLGEIAVQFRDRTTLDLIENFRMNVLQRKNWNASSSQQWRAGTANDPTIYGSEFSAWQYTIDALGANSLNADTSGFETSFGSWASGSSTAGRSTAQAHSGSASLAVTCTSAGANPFVVQQTGPSGNNATAVTAGQNMSASVWVRANTTGRVCTLTINWFKSSGSASTVTPTSTIGTLIDGTVQWQLITGEVVVPSDAAYAKMVVTWFSCANGEIHYIDDVSLARPGVFDWNWAADAEWDIFKYLYGASKVWPTGPYRARALALINQMRQFMFVPYERSAAGDLIMATDEFQQQVTLALGTPASFTVTGPGHHNFGSPSYPQVEINPSYYDFEGVSMAADLDSANASFWNHVAAGMKSHLADITSSGGSLATTAGLAPNWCGVTLGGTWGSYQITNGQKGWTNDRDINHTYDAFRTEHRGSQAWKHSKDAGVKNLFTSLSTFYGAEWTADSKIAAEHSHSGTKLSGGYEKSMMTAGAVRTREMVVGSSDSTAAAIRTAKLVVTDRKSLDPSGSAFWNDGTGSPYSYFTDMWMQMFYMEDAGLWRYYGQSFNTAGTTPLRMVDEGTSQDSYRMTVGSTPVTPPPAVSESDCEQVFWISPKGVILNLSDFVDGADLMAEIEGRGALPVRQSTINIPGEPGQFTTSIVHGVRTMAIPLHLRGSTVNDLGVLSAADPELLLDVLTTFVTNMDPVGDGATVDSGVGTLRLIRRSGKVFELTGRFIGDGLKIRQATHRFGAEVIPLVLVCDDPYWYSQVQTQPFYGAAPRSWFPMLRVGEPWLSSSAILGIAEIDVTSDVAVDPIYTAVGPGTNVSVTNIDDPTETIQFSDTFPGLSAGQSLVIDTAEGTVTGPGGADWFRYLKPGSRTMFELHPGTNNLQMSMAGSTSASYISVSWRSRQVVPR